MRPQPDSLIPALPKELSFDKQLIKIQKYLPQGLTEKILSQRDKIEGEHKQVTVLFCDMVGYTELSEKIGPEEVYSIMDQVYEILIHKGYEFDGIVNKMTGDGVMALFGVPITLNNRLELSRTYFEVGKHLLEPNSKYKKLNNITAEEYLEKAKNMFEEMVLQWDLDELDKMMVAK